MQKMAKSQELTCTCIYLRPSWITHLVRIYANKTDQYWFAERNLDKRITYEPMDCEHCYKYLTHLGIVIWN